MIKTSLFIFLPCLFSGPKLMFGFSCSQLFSCLNLKISITVNTNWLVEQQPRPNKKEENFSIQEFNVEIVIPAWELVIKAKLYI